MHNVLHRIKDYVLIVFIFSVAFEYWNPFGLQGILSITKIVSVVYIMAWIPLLNEVKFRKVILYIAPILGYIIIEFFSSAINNKYALDVSDTINLKLLQLLFILILIVSHLIDNPKLLEKVINSYVYSIVLLGLLYFAGLGMEINPLEEDGRLMMFGENPNMTGMKASIAVLLIIDRLISTQQGSKFSKVVWLILLVPLLALIVATASRGALLSVFVGVALMVFLLRISIKAKIVFAAVAMILSLAFFNYIITNDEKFSQRISVTVNEGATGRDDLWNSAYRIIEDHPIIGVGKSGAIPVMEIYSGKAMDTHNVYLYILVTSGLVGFGFFMTFIFRLARDLYSELKISKKASYLIVYFTILLNMGKAGGFINKTFLWMFIALLIAHQMNTVKRKYL